METMIGNIFEFYTTELNEILQHEDTITNEIKFPSAESVRQAAKAAKG